MKIGIQGGKGSTNEKAALLFCKKFSWKNVEIVYLITSEEVLKNLHSRKINYGVFAWKSTSGLVKETQEATQKFSFLKKDEIILQLDHALLSKRKIEKEKQVFIYSHPQALREHLPFLKKIFPFLKCQEEIDTALAAQYLSEEKYPENSLVIAPINCAKLYHLNVYQKDLERNKDYFTTFYLVQK